MIYRLKELKGDTIAVPQLVFSKLGIAEEYNVRVALYVLATGVTDPDKLCADLKLRSRISAESALSFWAGAGLLERYEENAAPGEEPSAPAPMTWAEIAAASRTDPMISSLIDCAQTGFARPLTHREMEKLVNLYVQEGFAPETVMLCVAYVASRGKRTMAAVTHELKVWRAEGVETGEQADADRYRDRHHGGEDIEADDLDADLAERLAVADGGRAADQRAEYQRYDKHLHQADKTVAQYIENTVDQNRISKVPFRHIIMDHHTTHRTG